MNEYDDIQLLLHAARTDEQWGDALLAFADTLPDGTREQFNAFLLGVAWRGEAGAPASAFEIADAFMECYLSSKLAVMNEIEAEQR